MSLRPDHDQSGKEGEEGVCSESSTAFLSDDHGFGTEGVQKLKEGAAEFKDQLLRFLNAKLDRLKLSVGKAVFLGIAAMLAACAAMGLAATLGVVLTLFLLRGAAAGLGALFGGHPWLGELILGAVAFAAIGAALWMALRRVRREFERRLVEKYEAIKMRSYLRRGLGQDSTPVGGLHE